MFLHLKLWSGRCKNVRIPSIRMLGDGQVDQSDRLTVKFIFHKSSCTGCSYGAREIGINMGHFMAQN